MVKVACPAGGRGVRPDRPVLAKDTAPGRQLKQLSDLLNGLQRTGARIGPGRSWSGRVSDRQFRVHVPDPRTSYRGHDEGWPQDSEVSIVQAGSAVTDFLSGGGDRPTVLEWKAWPAAAD
ncbi:hypothetical protein F1D05_02750 [Kribbella qitaiheensis]|uniref:Uncharacterized protein n=1 Tax=Kribbella qitaiheensis TaxID=1544730 RepID=A0A7G6WSQ8_9ACTN|nr:hypothetical protein F1D05_02750 [Kribbella qitaiheensis]